MRISKLCDNLLVHERALPDLDSQHRYGNVFNDGSHRSYDRSESSRSGKTSSISSFSTFIVDLINL